jgi:hypothetical protein
MLYRIWKLSKASGRVIINIGACINPLRNSPVKNIHNFSGIFNNFEGPSNANEKEVKKNAKINYNFLGNLPNNYGRISELITYAHETRSQQYPINLSFTLYLSSSYNDIILSPTDTLNIETALAKKEKKTLFSFIKLNKVKSFFFIKL